MATGTNNYNLTKPSPEDFYDIEVQNENMEVIDGKLKELETGIDEVQTQLGAHMGDYVRNAGFGVTGGTLTSYTLTLTPAPTVYIDGQQFTILPHIDCGATPTLNINGLGALTILKQDGSAVTAGDIKANKPLALVRVGSNFFMRSSTAGKAIIPQYTGSYVTPVFESLVKGYLVCTGSGTFSFINDGKSFSIPDKIDIFAVGGGGGGGGGYGSANGGVGGGGGGGGYSTQRLSANPTYPLNIVIGAGGTAQQMDNGFSGGATTITSLSLTANGGGGGGGYYGGRNGGLGGNPGGNGDTSPAAGGSGNIIDFFGKRHAGGGGGGGANGIYAASSKPGGVSDYSGGTGLTMYDPSGYGNYGGGGGGYGGGGGGACGYYNAATPGGVGGSGVVIIRWGY